MLPAPFVRRFKNPVGSGATLPATVGLAQKPSRRSRLLEYASPAAIMLPSLGSKPMNSGEQTVCVLSQLLLVRLVCPNTRSAAKFGNFSVVLGAGMPEAGYSTTRQRGEPEHSQLPPATYRFPFLSLLTWFGSHRPRAVGL